MKEKKYSEEFKREAIELSEAIGSKAAAKQLGLKSSNTIGAWKRWLCSEKKLGNSSSTKKPSYSDLEKEVRELRRALASEKKDNQILKDATVFFSQLQKK